MSKSSLVIAVVLVAWSPVSPARGDLIIDSFSSPPNGQDARDFTINGSPITSALDNLSVLGGSREIFTNKTGERISTGNPYVSASANLLDTDIFNFDQFSATARGTSQLIYDGNANNVLDVMGLGGVNLTQGDLNAAFVFEQLSVTGSGLLLTVNLYNAATGLAATTGPLLLQNGFFGDFVIPYMSFGPNGLATAMNVGAIEIIIDGSSDGTRFVPGIGIIPNASGSDLTFDLVTSAAVPEPSSMVLCGIASLMGFGYRLRKRHTPTAA